MHEVRREFKWSSQSYLCIKAISKLLPGSVIKSPFLGPWPTTLSQTPCLPDLILRPSSPFTFKPGCAPVRQLGANSPSHLPEEPETWNCFHVQWTGTLVRSWGDVIVGNEETRGLKKLLKWATRALSAGSDIDPCQCLWGLSKNMCPCAGSNLQGRRGEPLADFAVRLPWDSSINVCLLFVCWVSRGIFWAFPFFLILIIKTSLGYVLLSVWPYLTKCTMISSNFMCQCNIK